MYAYRHLQPHNNNHKPIIYNNHPLTFASGTHLWRYSTADQRSVSIPSWQRRLLITTNHPVEPTRPSSRNALASKLKPRSEQVYAMILYDHANAEPSCIERCLCHCSPKKRAPSGIADVPEIAYLSGVLFQPGDHSSANTVMTLKWAASL